MKIVAISGSPRVSGNTNYLIDLALDEANKLGVETEKIPITKYRISPCLGHDACGDFTFCPQKDDAPAVLRRLFEADGIILASPVYFYNVTAQLKALMDRTRFYRRHKQQLRASAIGFITVAAGGGNESAAAALTNYIKLISRLDPEKILRVKGLANMLGDVESKSELIAEARKLGKDLAGALLA